VSAYTSVATRLADVTADDVARAAQRYLAPTNRTVGWFDPTDD
jgi:predicted Zn-dependent peptidase